MICTYVCGYRWFLGMQDCFVQHESLNMLCASEFNLDYLNKIVQRQCVSTNIQRLFPEAQLIDVIGETKAHHYYKNPVKIPAVFVWDVRGQGDFQVQNHIASVFISSNYPSENNQHIQLS